MFKLTRSSQPHGLDGILEARGYRREAETLVKVLDGVAGFPGSEFVELLPEPNGEWIGAWRTLSDRASKASVLQALLNAVQGEAVYAVIRHDGVAVACARAVVSGGWVGLFDLAVAPAYRRRGFARELMWARLSWGARLGARRAFLQVMEENGIARGLQEATGFREAYRYWYRVQVVG